MLYAKEKLPKGKLTARFVCSRCAYQVYAGRSYLLGVSGVNEEEVRQNIELMYDATPDTEIEFK